MPAPVDRIRLLVERDGRLHKVANLAWSSSDVSLYITPYAPLGGEGHAGMMRVPGPGQASTWDYSRQAVGTPVRVALHESGRCHAEAGGSRSEPTWGRSLFYPDIAHIASISCFEVNGLPTVDVPKGPPQLDVVMRHAGEEATACHVGLFVCPDEVERPWEKFRITFERPGRERPLYLAVSARETAEAPDNRDGGVLVVAGWGPGDDSRPVGGVYGVTSPAKGAS